MIWGFAPPVEAMTGAEPTSFWVLLVPTIATLGLAIAACFWGYAAKLRAEAAQLIATSTNLKIDQVVHQTDGRVTKLDDQNKELSKELADVKHALGMLMGQEKERTEQAEAKVRVATEQARTEAENTNAGDTSKA